jgi:hypothetical protein
MEAIKGVAGGLRARWIWQSQGARAGDDAKPGILIGCCGVAMMRFAALRHIALDQAAKAA